VAVQAGVPCHLPAAVRGERLDLIPAEVLGRVGITGGEVVREAGDHVQDRLEAVGLKERVPRELIGERVVDRDQHRLGDAGRERARVEPGLVLLEVDRLVAVVTEVLELRVRLSRCQLVDV
jgi:hypothetical protein